MLFNSFEFILIYLPIVLVAFFSIGRYSPRYATLFVGLASIVFLGIWEVRYAVILVLSIAFNYIAAVVIQNGRSERRRKATLILAIAVNLTVIFIYKYLDFSISTANTVAGLNLKEWSLALPLGISFYTFTQTAFLVDVYSRKVADLDVWRYVLFVTYFPHLIAGPILHHKNIIPTFARRSTYIPVSANISAGLIYFTIGLAKKVLLADSFAGYATPVFQMADAGTAVTGVIAWTGALAYTFQIYFDFSGYSDMAVGLARMMNVDIPHNFNSPYKSASIVEFWRRWHISLSTFLRDYLYIPLGGSRRGSRHVNLLTTMVIGGLWHGASWTFVFWGMLHGVYLIVNHWFAGRLTGRVPSALSRPFTTALTFLLVVVAWVFFRAETFGGASLVLHGMASLGDVFNGGDPGALLNQTFNSDEASRRVPVLLLLGFLLCFLAPNTQEIVVVLRHRAINAYAPLGACVMTAFLLLSINASRGVSEFIYFNF